MMPKTWICCQIGAREHYAIPNELNSTGQLQLLITDYWTKKGFSIGNSINKNLQGRRQNNIPDPLVESFNFSFLLFEMYGKISGIGGWEVVMKRNEWFQKKALSYLKDEKRNATHLFSYSYAAKHILRWAKERNLVSVLGQIDPGPLEEEIVAKELSAYPQYQSEWQPAPQNYWNNWLKECELADKILVNSAWSRRALLTKNIPNEKIIVQPLLYTSSEDARMFKRVYPKRFDHKRPLRVLFLGQVILRKGVARILEAAKLLANEPIIFKLAGPVGINPIPRLPNLEVIGRVSRSDVSQFYQDADVFLFPTLSDGYAITQLEAFSWKLPIITTPFCGEVVQHLFNGHVLPNGSVQEIKEVLLQLIADPEKLHQWSQNIPNHNTGNLLNEILSL